MPEVKIKSNRKKDLLGLKKNRDENSGCSDRAAIIGSAFPKCHWLSEPNASCAVKVAAE